MGVTDFGLEGARVLLTGGAGAIGGHVARALSAHNTVVVVDNLSSGSLDTLRGTKVETVVADIRDMDKLEALFEAHSFDVIIHLAAHFANQNSVDFPASDLAVNVGGTLNLLRLAQRSGARFVYASSSCVYGQKSGALTEDLPVDDLHTPYAISKYTGEVYTKFYAEHFGVPSIALRFFNSFGPGEAPGRYRNVIPNFFGKALRGETLTITGTGQETRDFNYVDNTVSAILGAASGRTGANAPFDVFNVGTGQETTILAMAERVVELTGGKARIDVQGARRDWDHTTTRCADLTAIRARMDYAPIVGFDEGMARTAAWFHDNPAIWQ